MTEKPLILPTPSTDYLPDVVRYADRIAEDVACRMSLALAREQIDRKDIVCMFIQHTPECGVQRSGGCDCPRPLLFDTATERVVLHADGSCTRSVKSPESPDVH